MICNIDRSQIDILNESNSAQSAFRAVVISVSGREQFPVPLGDDLDGAVGHRCNGTVRLLQHVHVRRSVSGLPGPDLIVRPSHAGDLLVLAHAVFHHARILRLRRTDKTTRYNEVLKVPSSSQNGVGILCRRLLEAQ